MNDDDDADVYCDKHERQHSAHMPPEAPFHTPMPSSPCTMTFCAGLLLIVGFLFFLFCSSDREFKSMEAKA